MKSSQMKPLSKTFFNQPTLQLAEALLGQHLIHDSPEGLTVGKIVETEAYLFKNDPACHAHRGKTKRNEVMFGPPGFSYVYFIYGMYELFNVTSGPEEHGEAVLIRALEPIEGIELMSKRRQSLKTTTPSLQNLCNGPGKLVQALGISRAHNGFDLRQSPIRIIQAPKLKSSSITAAKVTKTPVIKTTRIGISSGAELPYRFYLQGNKFVSKT